MNARFILDHIKQLIEKMHDAEGLDKIQFYTTIYVLVKSIKEYQETVDKIIPNFEIYSSELLWHCASIARLDDGNGHDDTQHLVWAYGAINKLESFHCLNV